MHNIKQISERLFWVGANDRRLALFEGVYHVPRGVAYNAYLIKDEKTVLIDTVDKAVFRQFKENLVYALSGRTLDYLIVQHMEPDHSYAIEELATLYPGMKIVCNAKIEVMLKQFFAFDFSERVQIVAENDTFCTGNHNLHFIMAPMVHWPEVMVTYDAVDKVLFSADAFGCFGALNGALYADEVDFAKDYMDEARRYYTNIVGKYGVQVQMLLAKASAVPIEMICPLHGFVWRKNIGDFVGKYLLWSSYTPEEQGVLIAYASVYGNTENAAEILSSKLRDKGIKTAMYDVSVTPVSEVLSETFRFSHLVFASTTYNAGIFITMEELINDLVAHNIQDRYVAIIENGSWAATSAKLIKESLQKCKSMRFISDPVSIKSSVKEEQLAHLDSLADAIAATMQIAAPAQTAVATASVSGIDPKALQRISYGLYLLTTNENGKDNGCIINTTVQVSDNPLQVAFAVNKQNLTHDMIIASRLFNLSLLTEETPFEIFTRFGYQSGRAVDKFADIAGKNLVRSSNGIYNLIQYCNATISGEVVNTIDCGSHTLFIAKVTAANICETRPSVTYQYYFDHIKPKPEAPKAARSGYLCRICNYFYEGDHLPEDYICPLCKHGSLDFDRIEI